MSDESDSDTQMDPREPDDEPDDPPGGSVDANGDHVNAQDDTVAEAGAGAEDDDEAGEQADGLEDGDFIRLEYTARTVEDGQLVDTTHQEVAEEEGVADGETFEPRVVVIGAGHLFQTVEEDLVGREVGDSGSVVVPPEEAFGEYDPDEVRTVSADKIPEDDRRPRAEVTIDGDQGYLVKIIGGRARVDFNHPLAGDEVEYEYDIAEEVTDPVERARGLLSVFLDLDLELDIEDEEIEEDTVVYPDEDEIDEDETPEPETVTETVEKTTLYIEATPELTMNQDWMFYKQQIAQEIMRRTEIDRIVVQEILEGGGMGGMGGAMAGGAEADLEEALEEADLEDADVDEDELVEELEAAADEE